MNMAPYLTLSVQKRLFLVLFFICLGITVEVFFTAFYALISGEPVQGKPLTALAGYTCVWMAFIYGMIPLLAPPFCSRTAQWNPALRISLIVVIIYLVEYTAGFILTQFLGSCPWEYRSGWHVSGLIRLDYTPAWIVFAWFTEKLYLFVSRLIGFSG